MATEAGAPSLAVLIDADNANRKYAKAIFDEIAKLGEANVRRIYGDFSSPHLAGWNDTVQTLAILQHQQRNNTRGKNAADIALVIDAMDLMHKGKLDGVCLVSSDSDFTRLSQRLREEGLKVYGFGERKTPEAFRNACTRFIYVENLGPDTPDDVKPDAGPAPEPASASPAPPAEAPGRATRSPAAARAARKPAPAAPAPAVPTPAVPAAIEPTSKAVPIIMKAMTGLEDDDGWVGLSGVGSRITMIAPDFDTRTYGHSKLKELVEKCGGFELRAAGGTGWEIRQKNPKKKTARK
ncbi:MAG: NYN domain-containing protein [Thermohalobaculum sp.]|nr:NYN domain-containing protein [Thermohalobaculum sp.]